MWLLSSLAAGGAPQYTCFCFVALSVSVKWVVAVCVDDEKTWSTDLWNEKVGRVRDRAEQPLVASQAAPRGGGVSDV